MSNIITDVRIQLILLAAIVVLAAILLYLLLRRRTKGGSTQKTKPHPISPRPQAVAPSMAGGRKQLNEPPFGLQLILGSDQVIPISLPTTIGRSQKNTIVLDDDSISDQHARIYFDGRIGAVCIEDLESRNGIFLDGRPTIKNVLEDGARITMGINTLTFQDTGYLPPLEASGDKSNG